jgi:hypothetical protein
MAHQRFSFAVLFLLLGCTLASAQSPSVLYTWTGTGNIAEWVAGGSTNAATVSNSTPGLLTVVETGDPVAPHDPGLRHVIRDADNRRFESSTAQGGLDVTGLEALEIDVSHNGAGNINVQFFVQATPDYNYVWAGNDGSLNGNDFTLAGNTNYTLRFPLSLLTPAQQTYIRVLGLSVRDHDAVGNVTWNLSEVRSVGTPATSRILATHDVGTSEGGLQGAFVNFDAAAVQGNTGQGQSGLSQNTNGSGSLQWTDLGGSNGAAVSWGQGTVFFHSCCGPNSFNERLSDFSNYGTVTFRVSATDPLNAGGSVGVQAFFQTGDNFSYQTTQGGGVGAFGELQLPIDGQFHDLVFPLSAVTDRINVDDIGINLFSHANTLTMNVDTVRFDMVPGDYNNNGVVDLADYVQWRKGGPLQNEVDTPGVVNDADYIAWRERFGSVGAPGSGSALDGAAVPEPSAMMMALVMVGAVILGRGKV